MSDCLVWVVDDDPDDLELIEQAFKDCCSQTRLFESNRAETLIPALESLSEKEFPLFLLLDINMPVISGKILLERIKSDSRFRHLPVIMFSTSSSKKEKLECLEKGANCFLTKPATYTKMVEICSSLITIYCQSRK